MPNVNRWKPPVVNGNRKSKKRRLRFINKNAKNLPYGWTEPKTKSKTKGKKPCCKTKSCCKSKAKKSCCRTKGYSKINIKINKKLNLELNRELKK
jgi:hypothetical protein